MRYFDKLLNFFTSSYLNNTRFHHSTLGYLRIFFERNNKLKSTFSSLGNVFRNSKWSDLKAQNIKTSFIKSWSTYFTTLLVITLFLLPFFGTYYGGLITTNVPFAGEFYEIVCFAWTHLEDLAKSITIITFSTWSYFKSYLLFRSSHDTNYLNNPTHKLNPNLSRVTTSTLAPKLADNSVACSSPIEIMYYLSNATKGVNTLDCSLHNPFIQLDNLIVDHYTSSSTTEQLNVPHNFLSTSSIEHSFVATPKSNFNVYQLDLNSASLNEVSSYNVALSLTGLNTQESLKTSKEDRWLLRNSLLSESIIINSNSFTQSKKLLGVNFLSSDSASKNVWNSTKLNALTSAESSSFISNLQELFSLKTSNNQSLAHNTQASTDTSNFNFFENSRMWLTKKYFFTNQLKNNHKALNIINSAVPIVHQNTSNTYLFDTLTSLQQQNPNSQLVNLTLSLKSNSTKLLTSGSTFTYDMYLSGGDLDMLKQSNLSFLNKLTYSTSNNNLNYFTVLPYTGYSNGNTLVFKK